MHPGSWLQRHGESANNVAHVFTCRRLDPGLTEHGRAQIEAAARWYVGRGVRRLVSSTALRARESAAILGAALGLTATEDARLLDVDVGELEGQSERDPKLVEYFSGVLFGWLDGHDQRFPGGECFADVQSRLAVIDLYVTEPGTLLVGHAGLFALYLATRGKPVSGPDDVMIPRGGRVYVDEAGTWRIERPL